MIDVVKINAQEWRPYLQIEFKFPLDRLDEALFETCKYLEERGVLDCESRLKNEDGTWKKIVYVLVRNYNHETGCDVTYTDDGQGFLGVVVDGGEIIRLPMEDVVEQYRLVATFGPVEKTED